jgi:hypothetical protein
MRKVFGRKKYAAVFDCDGSIRDVTSRLILHLFMFIFSEYFALNDGCSTVAEDARSFHPQLRTLFGKCADYSLVVPCDLCNFLFHLSHGMLCHLIS